MTLCATLPATLKAMTVAATLSVTGPCPPYQVITFAPPGTVLDFTGHASSRLDIRGVTGPLTVKGFSSVNTPYAAINVFTSSKIALLETRCIAPGSACISASNVAGLEVASMWVTGAKADGIDLSSSTDVNIHDGACEDSNPTPGAHPDCVQMWGSLQHIKVVRMRVSGDTQGIDNFGPRGEQSDVEISDNTLTLTAANCISFAGVTALVVKHNRCLTLPGALGEPAQVRVTRNVGARVEGNSLGAAPRKSPP